MTARRTLLALCLILSSVAVMPTGAGATGRSEGRGVVSHRVENPGAAKRYWTRDRIMNVRPAPLAPADAGARRRTVTPVGEPHFVEEADPARYATGSETMTATSGTDLIPFERIAIQDFATVPEHARHGLVLFTSPSGGNFGCSGTALNSDNGSVVWTAGHCLFEGGAAATNVMFIPAYENGNEPFGRWPAQQLFAPTQWKNRENVEYDFAAFTTQPNAQGQTLVDVVGGRGIAFNQQPTETFQSFGYPGCCKVEFDGHHMFSCTSKGSGRLAAGVIAMGCDMEFGSSGGGWVIRGEYVASNVSGGDMKTWPNVALGPYLGAEARAVYDLARGGTSEIPQPTPTAPVTPNVTHTMKVTLRLRYHLVATGRLTAADGFTACAETTPFIILRYRPAVNTWYPVGKLRFTKPDGTFRAKLRDRTGRYAVATAESPYDNSNNCAEAIAVARHRHG